MDDVAEYDDNRKVVIRWAKIWIDSVQQDSNYSSDWKWIFIYVLMHKTTVCPCHAMHSNNVCSHARLAEKNSWTVLKICDWYINHYKVKYVIYNKTT